MRLAVEMAEKGRYISKPNPFVGAVIVKNDRIIGKGFTQRRGEDHAEIVALKEAGDQAKGADLYVTLEPCSHYGLTPPCSEAIIKAGISRVFAGIADPNPEVNGKGFQLLKAHGIEVFYPYLEEEIKQQLEVFLQWKTKNKTFVIMKNAVSLDGKIATESGASKWISNQESRAHVQHIRATVSAIVTGIQTVIKDNPMLNVREIANVQAPVRIILDPDLEIPEDCAICQSACDIPTIVIVSQNRGKTEKDLRIKAKGIEIIALPEEMGMIDLFALMTFVFERNFSSILVEAGPTLCSSFLRAGLVDKIYYFIAPKIIGGQQNVFKDFQINELDDAVQLRFDKIESINGDLLVSAYVSDHR